VTYRASGNVEIPSRSGALHLLLETVKFRLPQVSNFRSPAVDCARTSSRTSVEESRIVVFQENKQRPFTRRLRISDGEPLSTSTRELQPNANDHPTEPGDGRCSKRLENMVNRTLSNLLGPISCRRTFHDTPSSISYRSVERKHDKGSHDIVPLSLFLVGHLFAQSDWCGMGQRCYYGGYARSLW
jgi:hypothetical protein